MSLHNLTKDDLARLYFEITGLSPKPRWSHAELLEAVKMAEQKKLQTLDKIETDAVIADVQKGSVNLFSLFKEDELLEGNPTTDGLRRIFPIVVGDILETHMELLQAAEYTNANRATVKCTIRYRDTRKNNEIFVRSDIADASNINTKDPFKKHPSATAATMAEGRCLRKVLGIKITGEEAQTPVDNEAEQEFEQSTQSTDSQQHIIRQLSKKLDISVEKLLTNNHLGELNTLSYKEAQSMLKLLTEYQRGPENGGRAIPAEVLNG